MNWYELMFVEYSVIFTAINTIWLSCTILFFISWFFDFDPILDRMGNYDGDFVGIVILLSVLANAIFGLTWIFGGIESVPVANMIIFSAILICIGVLIFLFLVQLIIDARDTMIENKRRRQRNR